VKKIFVLLLFFIILTVNAQELIITEVMSSNNDVLADESGWKYPDWIEIYNQSGRAINLKGYTSKPKKWFFPSYSIAANEHMIVFADGLNKHNSHVFDTIIDVGSIWKYNLGSQMHDENWFDSDYNDSAWPQGPSGFGYGDNDDNSVLPATNSVFIRKEFVIDNPSDIEGLLIHMDFDDSFIVYLNGSFEKRINVSKYPDFEQEANSSHEANLYRGEHDFAEVWIRKSHLKRGKNVLAIEAHNYSKDNRSKEPWVEPADLSLIPIVSLIYEQKNIGAGFRGPSAYIKDALPHMHTNFKLKDGESVVLSDSDGNILDKVALFDSRANQAQGRAYDSGDWGYLIAPTPGLQNTAAFARMAPKVTSSAAAGFYSSALSISLNTNEAANIYYTLDGSEPNMTSRQYTGPFSIGATTVVRARAYSNNSYPGLISTFSYFINEDTSYPVISLVTAPNNLWSEEDGIFTIGKHAEANYQGANFKQDWRKPASVEFFESGQLAFQADAGIELFGQYSRSKVRKNLELKFNSGFGSGKVKYPVFGSYPVDKFDDLILRTSSNDYRYTLFRDMLAQSLYKETGLDTQAYKPASYFINGQYWGLINIREKMDENYLKRHYGVDLDKVDLIGGYIKENGKLRGKVYLGKIDDYAEMIDFVEDHDMSNDNNYNYIAKQIDIDNFISYMSAQIYFDNYDWPGRNIRFWRNKGGKWRWLVYDTDFAFGLAKDHGYSFNSLEHILSDDPSPSWESQPNASFLLNSLLENDGFKLAFIKKFYDSMYSAFEPKHVLARIDEFQSLLEPQMPRHIDRWGQYHSNLDSMNDWYDNINDLRDFAKNRPAYMQQFLIDMFGRSTVNRALGRAEN